jgi:hypothetical protein
MSFSFLPEDGRRSGFQDYVILWKIYHGQSKKTLSQIMLHHYQKSSDFVYNHMAIRRGNGTIYRANNDCNGYLHSEPFACFS